MTFLVEYYCTLTLVTRGLSRFTKTPAGGDVAYLVQRRLAEIMLKAPFETAAVLMISKQL